MVLPSVNDLLRSTQLFAMLDEPRSRSLLKEKLIIFVCFEYVQWLLKKTRLSLILL